MIRSHELRVLFLLGAATLVPIVVLGWLSMRILSQDRDIEQQRAKEGLAVEAGRFALRVEEKLKDLEARLGDGAGIQFNASGLKAEELPILYQPTSAAAPEPSVSSVFAAAETLEFERKDLDAAAEAYRSLSKASQLDIRAAALARLGRVLRARPDFKGATEAYKQLEQLGLVTVWGEPGALRGRQGLLKVLQATGQDAQLRAGAVELGAMLDSGAFPIDRATFENYHGWLGPLGAPAPSPASVLRTEAAIQLWNSWRSGKMPARGRTDGGVWVLALGKGSAGRLAVWLATTEELEDILRPLSRAQSLEIAIVGNETGEVVSGVVRPGGISLTPAETRLPFVLNVAAFPGAPRNGSTRRNALLSALSLAFLLMIAAAYGLYRTTIRELTLARQQSDFVSAVSHEFRTPLTSMRHLTDLLVTRGVASEERRTKYYELLSQETERLQRMVESLLSFGRMQAGAYAWRLEPVPAGAMVLNVVSEFRREPQARERDITVEIEEGLPAIQADREALHRALWNLLENAVKYSDSGKPISVATRRKGNAVHLIVEDSGVGIPQQEQGRIFQKFVRGAHARDAGIRGVGIGLALVQRIAEAHGGSVQVESEPGRGSTFTLVFPCPEF